MGNINDYKKSAKDLAFDKERAKYNKQIRELESQLKKKDGELVIQKEAVEKLNDEIIQLKDWIERLLEYTELSEDEMRAIVDKDKKSAEMTERISDMFSVFSRFGGDYFR